MPKLDVERYERMGTFFQKVLTPSFDAMNALMRKCGEDGYIHDFIVVHNSKFHVYKKKRSKLIPNVLFQFLSL